MNLEKIENKIQRLEKSLEKTNTLIDSLQQKRSSLENEIEKLEKQADIMRLEDFNSKLTDVGVDLRAVDISQVVQLIGEKFKTHKDENGQVDEINATNEIEHTDNDSQQFDSQVDSSVDESSLTEGNDSEDPFAFKPPQQ